MVLKEGGEFHSHAGYVPHDDIIGGAEGALVRSTKGAEYTVLRPTLEDFVVEMPRGAQVIYPKDLAPICMLANIGPGRRVFESGVVPTALTLTKSVTYPGGTVNLVFAPGGPPSVGDMTTQ